MKRLFYVIAAAALLLASANVADAQQPRKVNSKEIFFKGDFFVGVGVGPSIFFGEQDRSMSFHHRIAPAMDVYLGKWIIPCLGIRVAYSGGRAFCVTNIDNGLVYSTGEIYSMPGYEKCKYKQRFTYLGVRGALLFNVTNLVLGHNTDRLYDFTFYGGLGIHKVYDELEASRFGLSFGIINTFRITKALDAVLDIHCTAVPEDFEHEVGVRPGKKEDGLYSHDGIMTAAIGICYNF